MYEKLVENWLISANELSYQLPFCEVLLAEGYTILHVSRHGRGEHGKDVVARRSDGVLCTFQLKGGDVALPDWREIRGEIEELVQLPVRLPGVDEREAHVPHLVTNGELRGDAPESIKRYADEWERKGHPALQVWSRRQLLQKFIDANGAFLPDSLPDLRRFVELYVGEFNAPLPRQKLAALLEPIASQSTTGLSNIRKARVLSGLVLTAGYVVDQYERAGNYIAALEGWTITAAAILYVAERDALDEAAYFGSLALLRLAFERSLDRFAEEALAAPDWVVRSAGLADPHVYGARVTLMLGWLGIWGLDAGWRRGLSFERKAFVSVLTRELSGLRLTGEADWPYVMALALFLERAESSREGEFLLRLWAGSVTRGNANEAGDGVPSPYWLPERVLELRNGMLPPYESERFQGHAYTVMQCLDMLVRRLSRQAVAALWPEASQIQHCEFVPDNLPDYFRWHCRDGELLTEVPTRSASWTAWRQATQQLDTGKVPVVFLRHPEWLLPFVATYPHRLNRRIMSLIDAAVAKRLRLP